MSSKRKQYTAPTRKTLRQKLPNTALEFLRNKAHVEDLVTANNIGYEWYSPLFTLDVVDDFVQQSSTLSSTYFDDKVILNREGLLVFIKTLFPQGFEQRFLSNSKYPRDYLDNLLLETTFSIIFNNSYGTCSGEIGEYYATEAFEKMRKNLSTFDIAIILQVKTETSVGASLLSSYDSLSEYKQTLASGEDVDIEKYHQFLQKPDVQTKIKQDTSFVESQDVDFLEPDNDEIKEFRNEFHIIHHVKNLLKNILNTNKIIAFIITELGECKLPSSKYPPEDVWSVNLICGGSGGNGAYLISLFLFSVIDGTQANKWPPIGVLELAGGYENISGVCLYTKFGFKIDTSIRSSVCFEDYMNLPHIADFRQLDLNTAKDTMIRLITSKIPIAPFYKHPICYIKNQDLQSILAIILNIKDSFYDGIYNYLTDKYYSNIFKSARRLLLNKPTMPRKYTISDTDTDLTEIIRILFSMSGINPLDIENTFNNSVSSLSLVDDNNIKTILNKPTAPPPMIPLVPPPTQPLTPPPTTPPPTPLLTPPTTPPPTPPLTPPPTTPPCNNSNNRNCIISGGRKQTRRRRKRKSRHTKKYMKRSKTNKKRY